jgi:hypothetical protein
MAVVVPPSTTLALVTNMSNKHKSTSLSAVPVKNQLKAIGTEQKSDIIS